MIPNGIILTEQDLQQVVDYYLTQDVLVYDVEASYDFRGDPNRCTVTWISLATHGSAVVVPLRHNLGEENGITKVPAQYGGDGPRAGKWFNKTVKLYSDPPEQLDAQTVFSILKPLFASTTITKCGYGMIYDLIAVAKYLGFIPPPPYFDPLVGFWLLDENKFTRGLKEMTELRYDFRYDDEEVGKCIESHAFSKVAYYSFCDAKFTFMHIPWLKEQMELQNLTSIFNLEMAVLNVLIGMRLAGAPVDVEKIEQLRDRLSKEIVVVEKDIYNAAGKKFNVKSNQQKQDLLYLSKEQGGQGLKPWKLTKGGKEDKKYGRLLTIRSWSVDDSVLESFMGNPVADKLREYGDIDKILNTYVGSWLGNEDKEAKVVDGKIYADFVQYGTVTGRFSCRKPNLQNCPRSSTDLGKLVRSVFVAESGRKLVCADYSQIEYVVLAHYIEEGALYEGFLKGIDPHTQTAAVVFSKDPREVTGSERQAAKSLNFAITYGAGPPKVAAMMSRDVKEAKKLLAIHAQMFPEVYDFKQGVIDFARKRKPEPYVTTLLGRRRRVPDLNSPNEGRRLGAQRQIFNSLIQGGAADIMKLAMVRTDALLPDDCQMHLTVHDEIVVSCPDETVDKAVAAVYNGMTGPGISKLLKVPLSVKLGTGQSWSGAK